MHIGRVRWSVLRMPLSALLVGILGLALSQSASAVPVFARKYHTSCQTCHTAFPKLNPFGEAFRLNGYRMPGETEAQVKEKPVSLGAPAYKLVWPHAVYPSDLPGNAPVAINIKMANLYASSHDNGSVNITHNDFQFPQEANLFTAGTLGKKFSFFGELTFEDGGAEVEHAEFHVNSPFGPEHAVNFKIGRFANDLADGFQEMWLMTDNGVDTMFGYNPIGVHGGTGIGEEDAPAGISIPAMIEGIEMYGVVHHRLFYTVGLNNGLANPEADTVDGNSSKDVYGRIGYKFGGMGLDGDTSGETPSPNNWQEKSFRIGALGYSGNGKGINFAVEDPVSGLAYAVEDRTFNRVGLFGSGYWNNLNIFGVYLHGTDNLSVTDPMSELTTRRSPSYDTWFVQADYVFVPPFQASLRYESLTPGDNSVDTIRYLNANFTYLIRANIKGMLEYRRDMQDSKNFSVAAVLRFAI
jgi:hypothetical protein